MINQYDSTTVIPPGLAAEVDRYGNIVIWVDAVRPRTADLGTAGPPVATPERGRNQACLL